MSWIRAAFAASTISSRRAPGRPKAMFSRMLTGNSSRGCRTIATSPRSGWSPDSRAAPPSTSHPPPAPTYNPHHRRCARGLHPVDPARGDGLQGVQAKARVQAPLARAYEAAVLLVLTGEGLDDPHRLHRPLDDAVALALPLPHLARRHHDPPVASAEGEEAQRAH